MIVTAAQILKELHLDFIQRREVAVSALGSEYMMALTIPIEASLAQSGSGGDDSLIPGD